MSDFRADIVKEISNIPHPKVSDTFNLRVELPEIWDKTGEVEISKDVNNEETSISQTGLLAIYATLLSYPFLLSSAEILFEEARIPQPVYDIASTIIPLESDTTLIDINSSARAEVIEINPIIAPSMVIEIDFKINFKIKISNIPLTIFALDKLNIYGMNYANKHWHKIAFPDNEGVTKTKSGKPLKQKRDASFIDLKKRGRKSKVEQHLPSIWNLLFAVLQPPLTFGGVGNLLLPNAPYPYQWQGIKFLVENEHALLADDMGTGKTVMTTIALKILIQQTKIHHVLILCPPSVLYEWQRHLDDWAPELTAYLIRGTPDIRKSLWQMPVHIYVTTYDTLKGDIENKIFSIDSLGKFDVVVLDEAHHIKNMESKRFRAIKKLQPTRRWALTGTPVQNKIEDLASIFEFVYPGYLTSFDLRPKQIQERIKPYFLRRRKKEVMPDLPPKIYEPIELELDEEQDIAYKKAEAGIRNEFDETLARGEKVTKQHIFAKLTILKQLCNFAPRKFTSPKTDSLKERIEEIIESGNKVIVFSQYVDEGVRKIEKILAPYGVAKIVGGQTDTNRRVEIEKFKRDKNVSVLIASIRSGGEGLNLTEASYVVHFDHWWNPAVMWQAEDRVHRRGQTKGVNIYSYWMKDTIDERIRQKLQEKSVLFNQIVDGLSKTSNVI